MKLRNSIYDLLCLAAHHGSVSAYSAFRAMYKTSKQPMKKVIGIYRKLESARRGGLLTSTQGPNKEHCADIRFVITAAGRKAGIEHCRADEALRRPQFPRLAKGGANG